MLAVIKVRGVIGASYDLKHTLNLINLTKTNHLVLIQDTAQMKKMVHKVKDYVTYGEISKEMLAKVLEKKARITETKKLTLEALKEMKIKDYNELAEQLISGKTTLKKLGIKRVFRLKAPRKGYGRQGTGKPFKIGGALGYRATAIDDLIKKMI
ncbi:MAG: 50S ribosomal protein L30 [Candidatus Diapherotrites archaeon]|nr:50S ribosomal protein L30 [Candidatus Diapherotrites archaeon]